jgi:type VI secretion system secreted protein Hcp
MPNGTGPTHAAMSALIRLGAAFAFLAAALVADTSPAAAQPKAPPGSTRIFVTIEGTKQGKFKTEGGPQFGDRIPVLRFTYEIISPRDLNTGQASGKRQHRPVTITKDWNASSPQFFQAVTTNEPLKSVLIEVFRTNPGGAEEVVATIRLTDAAIARFRSAVSDSTSGDGPAGRLLDQVDFTFRKIEIANPVAKIGATDDWLVAQ